MSNQHKAEPHVVHDVEVKHYHSRLDNGWLPLPPEMQTLLGWKDNEILELVAIYGNQIVIRRKGALKSGS